jgi:hypothetical protein
MNRRAALVAALVLAALAFDPSVPAALPKGGLLLVVALVASALEPARWRPTAGVLGAAALAAWLGLSLAWARCPEPVALGPFLVLALVALAVSGDDEASRLRLARGYAAGLAAGAGVLAIGQCVRGGTVEAGFGNPNALGLALAPCLPLVAQGLARSAVAPTSPGPASQAWTRAAWGAALLLGLVAVALGRSRTAWCGLAVASLLVLRGAARFVVPASSLAVAVALGAGWREALGAVGGRGWIARVDVAAALEALPLGVGVGGFPSAYLEAQARLLAGLPVEVASARFVHAVTPHGDWLGLLATGGPLALALTVGLLALAWRGTSRSEVRAVLLVMAFAALGDDTLALPPVATLLGLLLPTGSAEPIPAPRGARFGLGAVLVVGAALVLPAMVRRYASQRMLRLAEAAAVDVDAHRRTLDRARRIDPGDGEVALASGLAWLAAREPEHALEELLVASRRLANVGTAIAIGNARYETGDFPAAVAAYREAARLDPGSFRAHANLVEALRRTRDRDGAERALEAARRLQPHHPKLERTADALRRDRMEAETSGEPR